MWPVDISTLLNEYERPPVWPDTAAREIDVNQEIPSSSATTSADGNPLNNAAIEIGNDEESEDCNTDMENVDLKSSVDRCQSFAVH